MSEILSFDEGSGILTAQGGVLLADILDRVVPAGWFLPVVPGTKFVTLGGAVANDVHGKNHHRAGSFGCHVLGLELVRSDGARLYCTPQTRADWFAATIGGLGLTGLVTRVDIQLKRIPGRTIATESLRFGRLSDFFSISAESDATHEYTVAWIDCLAKGRDLGRGWFYRGNHVSTEGRSTVRKPKRLDLLLEPPFSLVNGLSLRAFNVLYFNRRVRRHRIVDYEPFFFPLDGILNWNLLYGPRGFYQFQCTVPPDDGDKVIGELLAQTARHGQGSFLAVLKVFGDVRSPGLLSFPRPGPTLALDFPNRGERTRALLSSLGAVVREAGGAIYPAKDYTMSPETFTVSFPNWHALDQFRDPHFSSSFWRRVTGAS